MCVLHKRTIDKNPVQEWLFACPKTYRTGDREDKDGEINDQETRKGHGFCSNWSKAI
jgi:hypothetical protein